MASGSRWSRTLTYLLLGAFMVAGLGTYESVTAFFDADFSEDAVVVMLITGFAWLVSLALFARAIFGRRRV
ncbi:MAG: hypothetical protein M5U22_16720 [Thermoleophilia bacterium]|nr:hypothetical protein [Thermoleophilia bacterium]